MAERFDEFSKHAASKRSRRGFLKLFGVTAVSAAVTAMFTSRNADADAGAERLPYLNQWAPYFNQWVPRFNHTYPKFNHTKPPKPQLPPYFNQTIPWFNQTWPPK